MELDWTRGIIKEGKTVIEPPKGCKKPSKKKKGFP